VWMLPDSEEVQLRARCNPIIVVVCVTQPTTVPHTHTHTTLSVPRERGKKLVDGFGCSVSIV
jgi:hypothetical protein